MCAALDEEVEAFQARSLGDVAYPYGWLDATYVRVRDAGRVEERIDDLDLDREVEERE